MASLTTAAYQCHALAKMAPRVEVAILARASSCFISLFLYISLSPPALVLTCQYHHPCPQREFLNTSAHS